MRREKTLRVVVLRCISGVEDGEASSSKEHHIDTVISHTWHTSRRKKFRALSFQNSICFSLAHVVSLLTGALVSTFAALQVLFFFTDGMMRASQVSVVQQSHSVNYLGSCINTSARDGASPPVAHKTSHCDGSTRDAAKASAQAVLSILVQRRSQMRDTW